jgi:hypothetical protein
MWKKWVGWVVLVGVSLGVFVGLGFHFCWNKSEWASWVQAVGSIAAILAAARIASWQASAAKREFDARRQDEKLTKALTIKYVLRRARLIVDNAERVALGTHHAKNIAVEQVASMQLSLRAIPVFEIPSPELVFQLQRVDRDLTYVTAIIERTATRVEFGKRPPTALLKRIKDRIADAVEECDLIIKRNSAPGLALH